MSVNVYAKISIIDSRSFVFQQVLQKNPRRLSYMAGIIDVMIESRVVYDP